MTSYNRYSHHARRALTHANTLVTRYRHAAIDTAHLLVGVMLTEGSIGYKVLYDLNLSAKRAEPFLSNLAPNNSDDYGSETPVDAALKLAEDESTWLGQHYIGTEHILLGLTRINAGSANVLLKKLNVSPEEVRRQVRRALTDGMTELNLQRSRRSARLTELARRVINAAEQLAVAFDHETVGLGHLLLMLLAEKRSLAAKLLTEAGLDEARLRAGLEDKEEPLLVNIEVVLDEAQDIAERAGDHYTGTEHLLLTYTVDPAGRALLKYYGLSPERLYQRLDQHMRDKR